jgi:hypothetical protein
MQANGWDARDAMERVRKGWSNQLVVPLLHPLIHMALLAHHPMWISAAFHEQLVLFKLCHYAPGPGNAVYDAWRARVNARF